MINANGLRIGNFIQSTGYYLKVTELTSDNIKADFLSPQPKSVYIDFLYNPEPIPLTEEILLKCGAIYDNSNGTYWFDITPLFYIELIPQCDNKYAMIVGSIDPTLTIEDRSRLIADSTSLHELQNIYFAITKKELEINL